MLATASKLKMPPTRNVNTCSLAPGTYLGYREKPKVVRTASGLMHNSFMQTNIASLGKKKPLLDQVCNVYVGREKTVALD